MPEPLDYRNPMHTSGRVVPPCERVKHDEPAMRAVPIEFDSCIADTDDHAAASAIESALKKAKIEYFSGGGRERAARQVMLYVKEADRERAMDLAGPIFVRRAKFRAHPHTKPTGLPLANPGITGFF